MKKNKLKFRVIFSRKMIQRFSLIFVLFAFSTVQISAKDYMKSDKDNLNAKENFTVQQEPTISGRVTDDYGEPLPGVTILIKGASKGTVTDIDGNYTLAEIPNGATLIFSFVGMETQEIVVSDQTTINVQLESSAIGLDEVIAVGYATRKAGEVTGAVSTVSAKSIEELTVVDASEALRGASGVTVLKSNIPGQAANIRIRGLGTINDTDPLWVVDGVPGGNVSPNNIESMTILKDAAAQAIYGARAANGVVLVTTKSGRRNQEAQLSVNIKSGITQNTNYYDLLNTQEYGEMIWLEAANDGVTASHPLYGSGPKPDIPEYIFPARETDVDHGLYDDQMIHEDGDDTYIIMKANKKGTEWLKEADRNAEFRDISIDLNGGSETTTYAFQLGYLLEEGIMKHTGHNRFNLRSNVTSKLKDWIEIGENLGVTYSEDYGHNDNNSESSIVSWTYRMQPIIPVHDIMGNYAGTKAPGTGNGQNPIFLLDANKNDKTKRMNVSGNTHLKLTPLEGLSLQTLFGVNYTARHYKNPNFVEKAYSERGKYASLNEDTSFSMQWNWTNTVEYSRMIADAHDITVLLGTEAIDYSYNWVNASREEFFSKDFNYMQLATGLQGLNNHGGLDSWSLFSIFGRVNYNYLNKYLLEGVIRRDGSSRFGPDNRYGTFPAFSAAWRISNEDFMNETSDWLRDLKIRVGYGATGNDRVGNYNSYTNFAIDYNNSFYPITGANSTTGATGFYQSTFGNEDVKWETTKTTNFGLDVSLMNNLTASLDIWQRVTSDMLFPKQIPMILGAASPPSINVGEMKNRGIDFEVGYFNTALKGEFTYDLNFNISHYKNEIVKLSENENEFLRGDDFREMVYTRSEKGTSFPEFYGYVVEGIFQDEAEANAAPPAFGGSYNEAGRYQFKDVNEDGVINSEDRTYIGSPHPDFTAGLNVNLGYKGFDLVANFFTSYGNDMVNYVRRFIDFNQFRGARSHDRLYNSWGSPYLDDNTKAKLPKAESNDKEGQLPSTAFVEDASYLRLENLRLSYDINRLLKTDYFKRLQIFGQMSNVFTITSYSGLDPEVVSGGKNLGVDAGAWPTPRQIMFGVNLGF